MILGEERMTDITSMQTRLHLHVTQAIYWISFCFISGYATVYLLSKDFSDGHIGMIISLASLSSVVIQFSTGRILDSLKGLTVRKLMMFFVALITVTSFLLARFTFSDGLLSILYCLSLIFLLNLQPLVTSLIYEYINLGTPMSFSFSRGIGSLVFATTSLILGQWLATHSTQWLPNLSTLSMALLWVLLWRLPVVKDERHHEELAEQALKTATHEEKMNDSSQATSLFKKYPNLALFMLGMTFIFSFHTIVNVYLPQILHRLGGGTSAVGTAIAVAAFCEIPVMFGFQRLEKKVSVEKLIQFSVVFFFIRSLIYLFASQLLAIVPAQLLQGLSFAILIPAYAHYVNQNMSALDRVKGQTYMMACVTLGNVIGSFVGGYILEWRNVTALLIFGTILAFLGMVSLIRSVRTHENVSQ